MAQMSSDDAFHAEGTAREKARSPNCRCGNAERIRTVWVIFCDPCEPRPMLMLLYSTLKFLIKISI